MYEIRIKLRDAQEWVDVARWINRWNTNGKYDAREAVILDSVYDQIYEQLPYPHPDSVEGEGGDAESR